MTAICAICSKNYTGWGNNAEPVCDGQCCDLCNSTKVIPARIAEMFPTTEKKIDSFSTPSSASTNEAKMENTDAILAQELALYLKLSKLKPTVIISKKTQIAHIGVFDGGGPTEDLMQWAKAEATGDDLLTYLWTHPDVDGEGWVCEDGSRWAVTDLNGKKVRISFYSKKHNPDAFISHKIEDGKDYALIMDVTGMTGKKREKYREQGKAYEKAKAEAIKDIGGGMMMATKDTKTLLKRIVEGRRKSRGETCFYWHRGAKEAMWATNEDMREQAKMWKNAMKSGDQLQFLEANCQTKLINGEEWHILVCGHKTKDLGFDPLGMGFDDCQFLVSGFIYFFKNKENRDTIFKWLTR